MGIRSFLYSLWCMGVIALFLLTGIFAWSPFAEGGGARAHYGFYGPRHK